MLGNITQFGKTKATIVLMGAGLALAGAGVATAEPTTPPPTPPTTTAPAAPAAPGTVHPPNVTAGNCESGGGIVILEQKRHAYLRRRVLRWPASLLMTVASCPPATRVHMQGKVCHDDSRSG